MDNAIREMMTHYGVSDETASFLAHEPQMYVDGRFGNGEGNATIDVFEPSTACYLTSIPAATEADVDRAVAAANRALTQGPWATMKPNERQRILLKLADLIERDAQIIGEIETIDNGKALGPLYRDGRAWWCRSVALYGRLCDQDRGFDTQRFGAGRTPGDDV